VNASCTLTFTFKPTKGGTLTEDAYLNDNASDTPQQLTLYGTGYVPLSISPTSLTFPLQLLGTTSSARQIVVTNNQTKNLTITSIASLGDFLQTNTCPTTLNVGKSCDVNVTFTPTAIGVRVGTITLTDGATDSPQTVNLSGTATEMSLSTQQLTFAPEPVGSKSQPLAVNVTNVGKTALDLTGISITGLAAADFRWSTTCHGPIGFGATCAISVTFTPSEKGARRATLDVRNNGGGGPATVHLDGIGK
jgi:Abnormal spindle-like microcephaly-assoc'd, ASPM-SPD-2-Hydin